MQSVTIFTKNYRAELKEFFLGECTEVTKGQLGDIYFFSLPYECFNIESFMFMLEEAVLSGNCIIKNSKKLLNNIRNIVFTKDRSKILYDFAKILACQKQVNIDGYINFRLKRYLLQVDRILYFIVRREYN